MNKHRHIMMLNCHQPDKPSEDCFMYIEACSGPDLCKGLIEPDISVEGLGMNMA